MENNPPLHAFCLPTQVINSIQFNPLPTNASIEPFQLIQTAEPPQLNQSSSTANAPAPSNLGCTVCQTVSDSLELLHQHFKSDWHRFNLKLTTDHSANHPISQDDFLNRLEHLQDSLSGSEDSDSTQSSDHDDDDDDIDSNLQNQFKSFLHVSSSQADEQGISSDKFDQLLKLNKKRASSGIIGSLPEDPELKPIKFVSPTSPIVWFNVPGSSPPSNPEVSKQSSSPQESETVIQLGFYRCIFRKTFLQDKLLKNHSQDELGEQYKSELSRIQRAFLTSNFSPQDDLSFSAEDLIRTDDPKRKETSPPIWTLLMVGGGHFAAMVVSAIPKLRHVGKHKPPEIEPVILLHKTFHRYTTRRKQGGGQASHDAGGKGAAKSAGANLRRYNEQALSEKKIIRISRTFKIC